MLPIISRRHPFKFYGLLLLLVALLSIMGSMPIANYIEAQQNGVPTTKQNVGALAGVTFLLMIIYVIYSFIKSAPRIVINRDFISFNKQGFSFEEIDQLNLRENAGQASGSFLIGMEPPCILKMVP
ncbi:MAG: hypothetical protein NVV59_14905 [Chitinophagaceae bacterium]|nr:hypothetical protein [Chitinophagaceae bacterium]